MCKIRRDGIEHEVEWDAKWDGMGSDNNKLKSRKCFC